MSININSCEYLKVLIVVKYTPFKLSNLPSSCQLCCALHNQLIFYCLIISFGFPYIIIAYRLPYTCVTYPPVVMATTMPFSIFNIWGDDFFIVGIIISNYLFFKYFKQKRSISTTCLFYNNVKSMKFFSHNIIYNILVKQLYTI